MGPNIDKGEVLQLFVPGGWWKASEIPEEDLRSVEGSEEEKERVGCLISEVVVPGWIPEQHQFIDLQKVSYVYEWIEYNLVWMTLILVVVGSSRICGTVKTAGNLTKNIPKPHPVPPPLHLHHHNDLSIPSILYTTNQTDHILCFLFRWPTRIVRDGLLHP